MRNYGNEQAMYRVWEADPMGAIVEDDVRRLLQAFPEGNEA